MSFMKKQLDAACCKPLGRVTWGANHRLDAATSPPLVTTEEFPVGRKRGICKPGTESEMRATPDYVLGAVAVPTRRR